MSLCSLKEGEDPTPTTQQRMAWARRGNSVSLEMTSCFSRRFFQKNLAAHDVSTIPWVVPPTRIPVTTRIITFLVGNPYKASFATITGRGDNPNNTTILYNIILQPGYLNQLSHQLLLWFGALESWDLGSIQPSVA